MAIDDLANFIALFQPGGIFKISSSDRSAGPNYTKFKDIYTGRSSTHQFETMVQILCSIFKCE